MNEYPITITMPNGTQNTGFLLLEMSLPAKQFITLTPAANGVQYSGFPGGNPPAPTWSAVPNFLNETSSVSVNVLTTYLTPTTGVTCVLNGTLPTGWTFNGTTLAYNGTSVNASPTTGLTFTATLTSSGVTANSNAFSVQGQGTPVTDTNPPTVPLNVAVSGIGQTVATVTSNQSADPSPPGHAPTNLGNYAVNVKLSGTDIAGSPFSVAPGGVGTLPVWTLFDVGPQNSSIVQTGADLAITTVASDPSYPTTSAIGGGAFQLTSTGWQFSGLISSFTSANNFDNLRLEVRPSNATNAPYVAIVVSPVAIQSEYRPTAGGNATILNQVASPGFPIYAIITWTASTNTFTFAYTNTGNAPISLGTLVQAMGNTLYCCAAGNANSGATVTGTIKQLCVQTLPTASLSLTGLTPATSGYTVTWKSKDQAGTPNVSAASAAVSFTTSSPSGGGGGGGTGNGIFPQIAVQAISGTQVLPAGNVQQIAQYGLIVFGGNYASWPSAQGGSRDAMISAIKNQTHTGKNALTPIFIQYENGLEINASSPWWPEWAVSVNTNNWYLYNSGSSGTKSQSIFDSSYVLPNLCRLVGTDPSTGLTPGALMGKQLYKRYFLGTGVGDQSGMASGQIDGYMIDNLSQRNLFGSAADYERNGTNPSQTDPTATGLMQQGKADYAAEINTLGPTIIAGGNAEYGYDCSPTSSGGLGMPAPNGLTGKLGFTMQQFFWSTAGGENNVLNFGGFAGFMTWYVTCETNTKSGGLVVITGGVLATDYQLVRYSLTATLMRNGWALYAINSGGNDVVDPSNTATFPVFDEFWGGSRNLAAYLGAASATAQGAAQSTAWLQGVFRRDFVNGIALSNPAGNGSQTVALGGTFWHLLGAQVPSINNGQAVTSVTIPAGDGLILLRSSP